MLKQKVVASNDGSSTVGFQKAQHSRFRYFVRSRMSLNFEFWSIFRVVVAINVSIFMQILFTG